MRTTRKPKWYEWLVLKAFGAETVQNPFTGDYADRDGKVSEFTHHEEMRHKEQIEEDGKLNYLATWLFQFARGMIKYKGDADKAYHSITYERDAKEYAAEKSGTPYNPPNLQTRRKNWKITVPFFKIKF